MFVQLEGRMDVGKGWALALRKALVCAVRIKLKALRGLFLRQPPRFPDPAVSSSEWTVIRFLPGSRADVD